MKLHIWGMDFRRSPQAIRRKLSFSPEQREHVLRTFLDLGFTDIVYLSTCNRVEFYTTGKDHFSDMRSQWQKALTALGLSEEEYYLGYHWEGVAALRHLLRVASSLESLVVGEPQILGQLREALHWNDQNGFPVDRSLQRCFHLAFETAKKVRTTTSLGEKAVSVATLSLESCQALEGEIPFKQVVLVGRSPMTRVVAQWLEKHRPEVPVVWVNRDVEKLNELPEADRARKLSLAAFLDAPLAFSHLFTATASPLPIFGEAFSLKLGESRCALFDLAQPADIDTPHFQKPSFILIQLDDLKQRAQQNRESRAKAIGEAEKIIEEALRDYCSAQKQIPVMRDFSKVESQLLNQLETMLKDLEGELPGLSQEKIRHWANKLVKRNLHASREHLRSILVQAADDPRETSPSFLKHVKQA